MLSDAQLQSLFHFCFALTAHEKSAYTLMMHFASKHQLDPNAKSNLTEIYHRIREQFHQHYEDSSLDATKDSKVWNFDPDAIKIP